MTPEGSARKQKIRTGFKMIDIAHLNEHQSVGKRKGAKVTERINRSTKETRKE